MLPRRLRSLLFAPAVRPDLLRKMSHRRRRNRDRPGGRHPPDAKDTGRVEMRSAVADLAGQLLILVRVNDDTTPWHDDDLDSLPTEGLAGIVVPKIETIAGLDSPAAGLTDRGLDMPVIGGVETALGVADARPLRPRRDQRRLLRRRGLHRRSGRGAHSLQRRGRLRARPRLPSRAVSPTSR